jgi:type IV pilus assembly protein PilA
MKNRKGFTLIELMVVIMIVGILAAVAIPLMRGRVDSAKWSEGKAVAGTIATALRAFAAEKGGQGAWATPSWAQLGFSDADLQGTYFAVGNYAITASAYDETANPPLTFTITVTKPASISTGTDLVLHESGEFTGGPN